MENKELKLTFHGGVGTVTGSNFMLDNGDYKILVDCGLFQGCSECGIENRKDFKYNPAEIDILLVTHAHLDHVGRIGKLVKDGFRGKIYSTPITFEEVKIVLPDALRILENEAKKEGVLPIYEEKNLKQAFDLWNTIDYHKNFDLGNGFNVYLKDAGHVLGSAMFEITYNDRKIVFTGDVGHSPAPLVKDTEDIEDADYIIMESVYGDRNHESIEERDTKFKKVLRDTISRGGVLMIPAFSLSRSQAILHMINHLVEGKEIPEVPVFLDSPLAIKLTKIYEDEVKNPKHFNERVKEDVSGGDNIFRFKGLKFALTRDDSKAIDRVSGAKIIIAGSGMSNGGRILHHEKNYLGDAKNTLLFVGYQAVNSLGRLIQDGEKEVEIFGSKVKIRANIETISGFSAHKDSDSLVNFVERTLSLSKNLKKVFVVMGEPKSSMFLVQRLRDELEVDAYTPKPEESVTLNF
jgi:metallo-beta-lactamase family protein